MSATRQSLEGLLEGAEVIVCCGSGGVGKTTTAAALGLQAVSYTHLTLPTSDLV